jgi:hypothetical protein
MANLPTSPTIVDPNSGMNGGSSDSAIGICTDEPNPKETDWPRVVIGSSSNPIGLNREFQYLVDYDTGVFDQFPLGFAPADTVAAPGEVYSTNAGGFGRNLINKTENYTTKIGDWLWGVNSVGEVVVVDFLASRDGIDTWDARHNLDWGTVTTDGTYVNNLCLEQGKHGALGADVDFPLFAGKEYSFEAEFRIEGESKQVVDPCRANSIPRGVGFSFGLVKPVAYSYGSWGQDIDDPNAPPNGYPPDTDINISGTFIATGNWTSYGIRSNCYTSDGSTGASGTNPAPATQQRVKRFYIVELV